MATIHGKSGTVCYGATALAQATVTKWEINLTCEAIENTSMTGTLKARVAGLKDWTGTVDCYLDIDTGPTLGTAAALTVMAAYDDSATPLMDLALSDGTSTITGKAYAKSFSQGNPVDGMATLSISFEGTGALT